ncbi:MAG TPA: hypothetical protein VML75_13015 [Kofleriaceae bacterium]|nr:hypothetical protein [Kofleriaceae bacterium]
MRHVGVVLVVVVGVVGCGGAAGRGYPAAGTCPERTYQQGNWCDGPITTVGVVGVEPVRDEKGPIPPHQWVDLQDLERVDDTGAPYVYTTVCRGCGLLVGDTYRARLTRDHRLFSILMAYEVGLHRGSHSGATMLGIISDPSRESTAPARTCASTAGAGSVSGGPAYWEVVPAAPDKRPSRTIYVCPLSGPCQWRTLTRSQVPVCRAGADARPWEPADRKRRYAGPCNEQEPLAAGTVYVNVKVLAGYGKGWIDENKPAQIASTLIGLLNRNSRGARFEPASGVAPQLSLTLWLWESVAGTPEYTAHLQAAPAGKAKAVMVKSGEHPYATWTEAVTAAGDKLRVMLEEGWHEDTPCRKRNGDVLR